MYGKRLGIEDIFCHKIAKVVIKIYRDAYPELQKNQYFIFEQLIKEEERFKETLERGIIETTSQVTEAGGQLTGDVAFNLYESHGVPLELSKEIALSKGFKINKEIDVYFNERLKKHQELSRKGAEQKFKGGLADHSEQTTKYHTATHLLLAALRKVLGDHVQQKGSNITAERLRFDFSHGVKLTKEELEQIEDLINQEIKQDLEVKCEEMPLEEARKQGATGVFGEKYGARVKVYTISDPRTNEVFSKEICGGPHIKRTSELGRFIITKEESPGAGARRIRAILE